MSQNIKDKFTLNSTKYIDIKSKNKFYIKKDVDIILKQRFKRHLQNYLNNIDKFYERTLNVKPLKIDFDDWKKINVNTDYYKENNYKFQSSEKIIKNLEKLIDKLNQKELL